MKEKLLVEIGNFIVDNGEITIRDSIEFGCKCMSCHCYELEYKDENNTIRIIQADSIEELFEKLIQ